MTVTYRIRIARLTLIALGLALVVSGALGTARRVFAADETPSIAINTASAQPRQIEDQTQRAIEKQYSLAWKNLADALQQNRVDLLGPAFVGTARDEFATQIDQAKRANLSTRLSAARHNVQAFFYSPDGTAIQLHDTVELGLERLADGKSVHTTQREQKYLVVMTLVEDKWKVRVLQEVQ